MIVCRVAHLLLHEGVPPESIIVTTFTKKAANEMTTRLRDLLVGTDIHVGKLFVGTFHSICYKIIQKYGAWVNIEGYTIADEKDSLQILSDVLCQKACVQELERLPETEKVQFRASGEKSKPYDAKKIKRKISSAKSAGLAQDVYCTSLNASKLLGIVYTHYQAQLQRYKLMDFDDCLLYCHKIVSKFPVLQHIQHTLVDEFQDTNEIQLKLMYAFAKGHASEHRLQNNVTIVGDPDQSIYAFRDAQLVNFEKMRSYYSSRSLQCKIIVLEENYRSTSGILQLSESVMRQQLGRAGRTLRSQLSGSLKPVKATLSSADEEARWIALQIEYLANLPGDVVSYSDIAVLVRAQFQTRAIENELVRRKIPYLVVRGTAFWNRKEVSIMVDYLRCLANENDRLALMRTLNIPKRGLGPTKITEIEAAIDQHQKLSPDTPVFEILQHCSQQLNSTLSSATKPKLRKYLEFISEARALLQREFDQANGNYPSAIDSVFSYIYQHSGLQKEFESEPDMELNIEEVKTQLKSFEPREDTDPFPDDQDNSPVEDKSGMAFVAQFLELVSLYDVDPGKVDEARSALKVSISTIHGAKGLEWPVVFVPGVSEKLLPAEFALRDRNPEPVNEERRCFFVALTRAKHLLFISAYTEKSNRGWKQIEKVSQFLCNLGGECSETMELKNAEDLGVLYDFSNQNYPGSQADAKVYYDNYVKQMRVYVKGEADEELYAGFISAGKVKHSRTEEHGQSKRAKRHQGAKGQAPNKSDTSQVEQVPTMKAPTYILTKAKRGGVPAARRVPNVTSEPGTSSKAPIYVPDREGHKRRLGTRSKRRAG